jgi:16S rRNA (uracil1498-N3)-methyltransferase
VNCLLISPEDFTAPDRAVIRDSRRCAHVLEVHQSAVGDSIKLGQINGLMGRGKLARLSPDEILIEEILLDQQPPAPLPLTLLLGLPRPKMLKRVLQSCASLGVKRIYLINSYRVEKSYWQTPWLSEEAIREQLLLGLEQACDTRLPEVILAKRFKPFVEDLLPVIAADTHKLVAHPYTETPCPTQWQKPTTLAVGPEGGFIAYEVDLLMQQGFEAVHLGERILRVETAVPYLIGRLFSC